MTRLDWRSAALACTADPEWRTKIWIGGWSLMIPFAGWPMVLGYRRLFVEQVLDRGRPLLPVWKGNRLLALRHGLTAMAVIHTWYLPSYLWLALRTAEASLWSHLPWLSAGVFLLCFSVFSPLTIPAWLLWLRSQTQTEIGQTELVILTALFAAVTFCIPAGFLRVSRTRDSLSAFHLPANLRLIAKAPRDYSEAWLGSVVMSLAGHLSLPLAPWGVVWCYLSIIYCFNEAVGADGQDDTTSWFGYFRRDHWKRYEIRRTGLLEVSTLRLDDPGPLGPPAREITALCVGPLRLLLPLGT